MRRRKSLMLVGLAVLATAAGLYLVFRPADAADQPRQAPPVPVELAPVKQQDLPVYLRGIGTVQAFYAVDIQAQVSGILEQVPVREGQEVKKGDVLAVIDPRPYQAALDQAQAQRQQDQAQLENAQLDLKRYQSLAQRSFAPQQQVDTQRATVSRLQGRGRRRPGAIEEAQINLGYCVMRSPHRRPGRACAGSIPAT